MAPEQPQPEVIVNVPPPQPGSRVFTQALDLLHRESAQWWLKLLVQPLILLLGITLLLAGLGVLQHQGLLVGGNSNSSGDSTSGSTATSYICPMLCTPPLKSPGRCPVCDMQLVPATKSSRTRGDQTIEIGAAARRIANIQTVAATRKPAVRQIRSVGSLHYDEGSLKEITAWVDGRIEKLTADYTGVTVRRGEPVAVIYSPELYSAQVELLLARRNARSNAPAALLEPGQQLYESTRQRALELGMTAAQLDAVEASGMADSRLQLIAPVSGTVIEKQVVEGQYVREGQQICKLADLSSIWLILQLFPEDAALIRYGQLVTSEVQSLPGKQIEGRVAFVDPAVDLRTRTVGVRVVISNPDGQLRIGDFATATINVPLSDSAGPLFDPELASRWISPRHPQITSPEPGQCPICGLALVPASELGFTSDPQQQAGVIIVPEDAVLVAGEHSLVYVESNPGRFATRKVTLGPRTADGFVIVSGLEAGEFVATRGNFLIDSQMQLAGNPSLIDPEHAQKLFEPGFSESQLAALSKLPETDRILAEQQQICPVTQMKLGSMGVPLAVTVDELRILLCCKGCVQPVNDDPQTLLRNLTSLNPESSPAGPDSPASGTSPIERPDDRVPLPPEAATTSPSEPQQ